MDYLKEAVTAHYGERCKDDEPGCPCCDAWRQYDALTKAAGVRVDVQGEEIAKKLSMRRERVSAKVAQDAAVYQRHQSGLTLKQVGKEYGRSAEWARCAIVRHERRGGIVPILSTRARCVLRNNSPAELWPGEPWYSVDDLCFAPENLSEEKKRFFLGLTKDRLMAEPNCGVLTTTEILEWVRSWSGKEKKA